MSLSALQEPQSSFRKITPENLSRLLKQRFFLHTVQASSQTHQMELFPKPETSLGPCTPSSVPSQSSGDGLPWDTGHGSP